MIINTQFGPTLCRYVLFTLYSANHYWPVNKFYHQFILMEPRSSFPNTSVHSKAFQLYTRTFGATSSLDFWYVSYSFLNGLLTVCSNVKIRIILNYHKATLVLLQVRWKKKNIHIQISNSCLICLKLFIPGTGSTNRLTVLLFNFSDTSVKYGSCYISSRFIHI